MGYGGGGGGGGGGGSGGSGGAGGGGGYTTVGGGSAFGGSDDFELPSYNQAPAGSIRFNTDSKKLEVYILGPVGVTTLPNGIWMEVDSWSPDLLTGGTRGLLMGGNNPSSGLLDEIVYINVATTSNSISFGELTVSDRNHVQAGTSDRTRAISAGGNKHPGAMTADIEFVTISSTGNATDFGVDLTSVRGGLSGASNGTRGIFAGGYTPTVTDTIEYLTIQSTGVAVNDFGNLSFVRQHPASLCSSTRGIFAGGRNHPAYYNAIEFVTMSTLGNAADFGDLTVARGMPAHGITSNSVRGIIMGGYGGSAYNATIDYVTITTLGNARDFGDLSAVRGNGAGVASPIRCVMMGGVAPGYVNIMEYVQIMSTGDAKDFGDLNTMATGFAAGASNGHGGL